MDSFAFLGELQMRERTRRMEEVSREAWKRAGNAPEFQPRRRFPLLRKG